MDVAGALDVWPCGVLAKSVLIAGVPWIALLGRRVTFALYAVTRKRLKIDPILGLFVETLICCLPATFLLFWLAGMVGSIAVFWRRGAVCVACAMFVGVC